MGGSCSPRQRNGTSRSCPSSPGLQVMLPRPKGASDGLWILDTKASGRASGEPCPNLSFGNLVLSPCPVGPISVLLLALGPGATCPRSASPAMGRSFLCPWEHDRGYPHGEDFRRLAFPVHLSPRSSRTPGACFPARPALPAPFPRCGLGTRKVPSAYQVCLNISSASAGARLRPCPLEQTTCPGRPPALHGLGHLGQI